jgi:phosphatidate cytidylyltransferase
MMGASYCVGAMGLVGLLIVEEITHNFLKLKRSETFYISSLLLYLALYLIFLFNTEKLIPFLNTISLGLNLVLIWYLFKFDNSKQSLHFVLKKFPLVSSVFVFIPISVISGLFYYQNWKLYFMALVLINFGMDTGAWFFGKNFGKTKLWPEVSPKKTVEGLIGGMFFSGILGLVYWKIAFGSIPWVLYGLFFIFALFSQVGDLVQSKIKRYFDVKDSSALIPGHGGVYDRVDSLLFIAPFFLYMLRHLSI